MKKNYNVVILFANSHSYYKVEACNDVEAENIALAQFKEAHPEIDFFRVSVFEK